MCQSRTSFPKEPLSVRGFLIWGQIADTIVKRLRKGASKDVKLREADIGVYKHPKGTVKNFVRNLGRIALRRTRKKDKCNSRSVHSKGKVSNKLEYVITYQTKISPYLDIKHVKMVEKRPEGTQLVRRFK